MKYLQHQTVSLLCKPDFCSPPLVLWLPWQPTSTSVWPVSPCHTTLWLAVSNTFIKTCLYKQHLAEDFTHPDICCLRPSEPAINYRAKCCQLTWIMDPFLDSGGLTTDHLVVLLSLHAAIGRLLSIHCHVTLPVSSYQKLMVSLNTVLEFSEISGYYR